MLYVLGANGTINLPSDSGLVEFTRQKFLSDAQAYALIAVVVLVYVASQLVGIRRRQRAELTPQSVVLVVVKAVLLAVGLSLLTWYLGIDRGWGYLPLFFAALVVVVDLALPQDPLGPARVRGRRQRGGRAPVRHQGQPHLLLGVCADLGVRRGRWSAGRGTADLGVAEPAARPTPT